MSLNSALTVNIFSIAKIIAITVPRKFYVKRAVSRLDERANWKRSN